MTKKERQTESENQPTKPWIMLERWMMERPRVKDGQDKDGLKYGSYGFVITTYRAATPALETLKDLLERNGATPIEYASDGPQTTYVKARGPQLFDLAFPVLCTITHT